MKLCTDQLEKKIGLIVSEIKIQVDGQTRANLNAPFSWGIKKGHNSKTGLSTSHGQLHVKFEDFVINSFRDNQQKPF